MHILILLRSSNKLFDIANLLSHLKQTSRKLLHGISLRQIELRAEVKCHKVMIYRVKFRVCEADTE